MFALIYDEHDLAQPRKRIISVHRTRATAEKALATRMKKRGVRVWDCITRIVWVKTKAKRGEFITAADFETWQPGEKIPYGERQATCDYAWRTPGRDPGPRSWSLGEDFSREARDASDFFF
jgi:hypothetical protein